jgi:hypothetical protein
MLPRLFDKPRENVDLEADRRAAKLAADDSMPHARLPCVYALIRRMNDVCQGEATILDFLDMF